MVNMVLGSRQSRMIWVPLGFPLLTEKQNNHKEPGDFSRLEYGWLSPELGQPNSSMSRYGVHRHPCSYKEQPTVWQGPDSDPGGVLVQSRVALAFLLKSVFCPSLCPGYWPPQA